jgi:phosphatidylserine/phosphatidylglycerophosphate/cardiolipin synthase-like enzyme
MWKTVAFSIGSLAFAAVVVCWIAGVPAPGPRKARPDQANRPGRPAPAATPPAAAEDDLSVYFSPNGGCTEAIVREIGNATQCVYVQAAQFTSSPIAKALVSAKERGVDVRVVIDRRKDGEKSEADRLVAGGVPTFADGMHHTAHNKVILIDHRLIFTGSFNFTLESEAENAENLLLIRDKPRLVAAYEANFKEHLSHSTKYGK